VYDATYDSGGNVLSFAVQFSVHCDADSDPQLEGFVSYQSSVTLPTWIVPSSSSADFGPIPVGRFGGQALTWTNLGGASEITGLTFSGSDANDWAATSPYCETTLGPGQVCDLLMSFIPSAPGARQATVTLVDSQSPTAIVSLSGVGTVGYYTVDSSGHTGTFGDAVPYGSVPPWQPLNAPIVSLATTPDGFGYWLAGKDGGVFGFGEAPFFGSMAGHQLNQPIVGIVSTPGVNSYWLVAADGGIFTFAGAQFYGSMGGHPLNQPVVGMVTTPDGKGYWLVAADGGIFSFGDAQFYGSMGGHPLNQPVVGMATTPDGKGYWLVAADGGIFSFGDAQFYGSMGGHPLNQPVVGMTPSWDGKGYWFVASDGGVFSFGDAPYLGSAVGSGAGDVVGISTTSRPVGG
jgi:hypothetical protein